MATLTRPKTHTKSQSATNPFLDSEVPSPFPIQLLAQRGSEHRPLSEDLVSHVAQLEIEDESLAASAPTELAAESSTTVALVSTFIYQRLIS
jgi:hypothetical protein